MNTHIRLTSKAQKKGYISNSNLTLLAIASALFPRILNILKFPSPINFLHFALIPLACGNALMNSRSKDLKQIAISKNLLFGLFFFLTIVIASALLNGAGLINAILSFLLLAEPFILILTIVCIPMTAANIDRFRHWIFQAAMVNLIFSYVQKYVFNMDQLIGLEDNIKGIFIGQGAGHVLSGSVAMTFAVYYFVVAKDKSFWFRSLIVLLSFYQLIISDTKQVLIAFAGAYILLYLVNLKDVAKALIYIIMGVIGGIVFYWAIYRFPFLQPYTVWIRPELYGSDGEATMLKFAAFRIAVGYYHSPLNWLFGLGPGHTVGRLGGWMIHDYWSLLGPLGATIHQASFDVWGAVRDSWLGDQSSLFSPLFGWAGIWGDLGLLGLGAYFYLSCMVWKYVCIVDISKFLLLTVFVFGLIFSQLEEPGYTLFAASMVGLGWHESRNTEAQAKEKV